MLIRPFEYPPPPFDITPNQPVIYILSYPALSYLIIDYRPPSTLILPHPNSSPTSSPPLLPYFPPLLPYFPPLLPPPEAHSSTPTSTNPPDSPPLHFPKYPSLCPSTDHQSRQEKGRGPRLRNSKKPLVGEK